MKLTVLGSGSTGNAVLIVAGNTRVLVDAGMSAKEIARRLAMVGEDAQRLDAVLVTHEHGDHAGGLRVLDDALLGDLFDDAHALLAKRIAKNAEHLGAAAWFAAAHAALVDAHVGEPLGGVGVGAGPANGLANAINPLLVVVGDGGHRGAGVGE